MLQFIGGEKKRQIANISKTAEDLRMMVGITKSHHFTKSKHYRAKGMGSKLEKILKIGLT